MFEIKLNMPGLLKEIGSETSMKTCSKHSCVKINMERRCNLNHYLHGKDQTNRMHK